MIIYFYVRSVANNLIFTKVGISSKHKKRLIINKKTLNNNRYLKFECNFRFEQVKPDEKNHLAFCFLCAHATKIMRIISLTCTKLTIAPFLWYILYMPYKRKIEIKKIKISLGLGPLADLWPVKGTFKQSKRNKHTYMYYKWIADSLCLFSLTSSICF